MSRRQAISVAGSALLLGLCLTVLTFLLSPVSHLVPQYVVVATSALLLLCFIGELRTSTAARMPSSSGGAGHGQGWTVTSVLALPALVVLIGLVPAVGGFAYALLQRTPGLPRWLSLTVAGCLSLAVYGIGYMLVGQRVLDGWLWSLAAGQ